MSINQIITTGRNSVLAHQAAIATVSKNAANISTPGYSKNDAVFTTIDSSGVTYSESRRSVDNYLGLKILAAAGRNAYAETSTTTLLSIETMFIDGEGGLGDTVDDFFNAIRALTTAPADSDLRQDLVAKAETMTQTISTRAKQLLEEKRRTDQQLDGMVTKVNEILKELGGLNGRISALMSSGDQASDLQDRRDLIVEELAEHLDVTSLTQPDGSVMLLFKGGQPVLNGEQYAQFAATPDSGLDDMRRIDMIDISGTVSNMTGEFTSGKIGGILNLRDNIIPDLEARLDSFAYDLATNFNAVHSAGFGLNGATGVDFFVPPAAVEDAASLFNVSASVLANADNVAAATTATDAIGGNDNLLLLQNLEDVPLTGGGARTFREEIGDLTGFVGRIVRDNRSAATTSGSELAQLRALKQSKTGVSLDEEMIDIVRFQRAFQAGTRIISTVDEMMQSIIAM